MRKRKSDSRRWLTAQNIFIVHALVFLFRMAGHWNQFLEYVVIHLNSIDPIPLDRLHIEVNPIPAMHVLVILLLLVVFVVFLAL